MKPNQTTGISWANHTWNPTIGCTILSAGCTNCYAMRTASRLQKFGMASYAGVTRIVNHNPVWTGRLNRASDEQMRKPLKIREPSRIFVNSMSDLFHESVQDLWRLEALEIMRQADHHQYLVLTKRPEEVMPFVIRTGTTFPHCLWLGVSVERADVVVRIEALRTLPAAIRFLSIEPLIGPCGALNLSGIHWVIIGGESGPGARPCRHEWVRDVIDQCEAQNVAIYFKQWGVARNNPLWEQAPPGTTPASHVAKWDPDEKGGHRVDGVEYHEWPR